MSLESQQSEMFESETLLNDEIPNNYWRSIIRKRQVSNGSKPWIIPSVLLALLMASLGLNAWQWSRPAVCVFETDLPDARHTIEHELKKFTGSFRESLN